METHEISQKELEVIRLKSIGLHGREIADRLNVSRLTVQTHFQNIRQKLGVQNEIEMAIWYRRIYRKQKLAI